MRFANVFFFNLEVFKVKRGYFFLFFLFFFFQNSKEIEMGFEELVQKNGRSDCFEKINHESLGSGFVESPERLDH